MDLRTNLGLSWRILVLDITLSLSLEITGNLVFLNTFLTLVTSCSYIKERKQYCRNLSSRTPVIPHYCWSKSISLYVRMVMPFPFFLVKFDGHQRVTLWFEGLLFSCFCCCTLGTRPISSRSRQLPFTVCKIKQPRGIKPSPLPRAIKQTSSSQLSPKIMSSSTYHHTIPQFSDEGQCHTLWSTLNYVFHGNNLTAQFKITPLLNSLNFTSLAFVWNAVKAQR